MRLIFVLSLSLLIAKGDDDLELLDDDIVNHVGVLDLLDQYVLHVEKQEKPSMDLLDQYVLHVGQAEKQSAPENAKISKSKKYGSGRANKTDYETRRWVKRKVMTVSDNRDDADNDSAQGGDRLWTHSEWLDNKGKIKVSWVITGDYSDSIMFQIEAVTKGYVSMGFASSGEVVGTDVIIAWVDQDGTPRLIDCHMKKQTSLPEMDNEQNYMLLAGYHNKTHTIISFSRFLDTCDKHQDLKLGSDTVRLIWTLHDHRPEWVDGELVNFASHGRDQRGVRSLHLLAPQTFHTGSAFHNELIHYWDVGLNNVIVPDNMDTLYWCKIFKAPPIKQKHHIIGYEPFIQEGHESFIHHILLYECVVPHNSTTHFDQYSTQKGAACYGNNMPSEWEKCITPVVAWAIGSKGELFPEHVGIPLVEDRKSTYFMMEVHYDNPLLKEVWDSSGLRIFHTSNLRQYDAAILESGITVSPLHIVPPRQREYRTAGYCSSLCTQKMFPQTGIKLVSVMLHSHLAGKKMRVRHIRDEKELPTIVEDGSYDFGYQQSRKLEREVEVLPGDEIITECTYQTPNRTEPTFGGYSTKQEMCLAFILYYPKTSLAKCHSMTPVKYFFETFGVKQFYNIKMDTVERIFLKVGLSEEEKLMEELRRLAHTSTSTSYPTFDHGDDAMNPELNNRAISTLKKMKDFSVDGDDNDEDGSLLNELVISEPPEFRNKTFTSHLFELPWEERLLTQRVEESLLFGQHMVFCRKQDDELAIPAIVSTFPNFTELQALHNNGSHCSERSRHSLRINNSGTMKTSFLSVYITAMLSYVYLL